MKRLGVHIPESVGAEIDRQVLFIAQDSVNRAFAWESRLRGQLERLADSHGHSIDEEASARYGRPVRKIVFERTYLIFYQVDKPAGAVEVIGFRHGARLPRPGEP